MVCKVCGRDKNIVCNGMCCNCYQKQLKERKKNGFYKDKRGGQNKGKLGETTKEIVKMLREGKSQIEIARHFGFSRQYIHTCKKYMDIV